MLGPEDKVIELKEFNGIWARGNPDEVPQDHFIDCLNLALVSKGKAITRNGLSEFFAVGVPNGEIVRFFQSSLQPLPVATDTVDLLQWLFLDKNNNLYVGNSSTPILTLNNMNDFAALNMFNKTFISPNGGRLGSYGQWLQIYYSFNGTFILRNAAGPAPRAASAVFAAANDTNAGHIPAGPHQFAVVYVTDTGFVTQPRPKVKVSAAITITPGNPTIITNAGPFDFVSGDSIEIQGMTGTWSALNNFWLI